MAISNGSVYIPIGSQASKLDRVWALRKCLRTPGTVEMMGIGLEVSYPNDRTFQVMFAKPEENRT